MVRWLGATLVLLAAGWLTSCATRGTVVPTGFAATAPTDDAAARKAAIAAKLKTIIIPKISFEDTPCSQVVAWQGRRSRELDPEGKGVNFVLVLDRPDDFPAAATDADKTDGPDGEPEEEAPAPEAEQPADANPPAPPAAAVPWVEPIISIDFDNVPLGELVRCLCERLEYRYCIEPYAVLIGKDIPLAPPDAPDYADEGVDLALIHWMLSLTPTGRLQVLQNNVNNLIALRHAAGLPELPEHASAAGQEPRAGQHRPRPAEVT